MDTILNMAIVLPLMEAKGSHSLSRCVSHLTQRETCSKYTRLTYEAKGDVRYRGASPFYLTAKQRISIEYSPWDPPSIRKYMTVSTHACT
jgi:hypothetical protein